MLHKAVDLLGTEVMFVFIHHFIASICVATSMILILLSYNWLAFNIKLSLLLLVISLPKSFIFYFWRFVYSFFLSLRFMPSTGIMLFKFRLYCFKFLSMPNDWLTVISVDFLGMPLWSVAWYTCGLVCSIQQEILSRSQDLWGFLLCVSLRSITSISRWSYLTFSFKHQSHKKASQRNLSRCLVYRS